MDNKRIFVDKGLNLKNNDAGKVVPGERQSICLVSSIEGRPFQYRFQHNETAFSPSHNSTCYKIPIQKLWLQPPVWMSTTVVLQLFDIVRIRMEVCLLVGRLFGD
jgi:hypothetical protein